MAKIVSASDANRQFSRVLREVEKGETYTITSHGEPVAQIVPMAAAGDSAIRLRAWRFLLRQLRSRAAMNAGSWTREELYQDDAP
ncbi:MAG TPA: type II toxin-antitoxin system prevent-host-death family antitoxin [Rhizomicrobium sp.]|nr:type II toxin-antitoxin system prevent-host-death family antitoxin [Rhizomicrobium sp.]